MEHTKNGVRFKAPEQKEFVFTFRVYRHGDTDIPEREFVAVQVIAPHISAAWSLFQKYFPQVTQIDEDNIGVRPVNE